MSKTKNDEDHHQNLLLTQNRLFILTIIFNNLIQNNTVI